MNTLTRGASLALSWLALAGNASAQNASLADGLQWGCNSTVTVQDGADLTLRCAGNLSLQGLQSQVVLQRSGSITLEATQDLSLSGLSLVAPLISLASNSGRLLIASDVVLDSSTGTTLGTPPRPSGDIELRTNPPGQVIDVGTLPQQPGSVTLSPVPEPTTGLLGLMGGALALAWRFARGQADRRH